MKKVILRMNEEEKFNVIKNVVINNKHRAAIKLNCTLRTINNLLKVYKTKGKAGFVHGNRGNIPVNKVRS